MKTVKTLQLSAGLASGDPQLQELVNEARELLAYAAAYNHGFIVQFSIEVEDSEGGSTKLQYARRDA